MSHDHRTFPSDLAALPLLPLRDVVVFPHMVIPLFVGAAEVDQGAGRGDGRGQAHPAASRRSRPPRTTRRAEDLYEIGSVATVLQMLKLPDGTVKVLVEGTQRAHIRASSTAGEYLVARRAAAARRARQRATRSRRCAARCSRSSTST